MIRRQVSRPLFSEAPGWVRAAVLDVVKQFPDSAPAPLTRAAELAGSLEAL
jgi:hypothetical protein